MDLLSAVEGKYLKKTTEGFNAGDTVRVQVKVREGDKERLQTFEGVVIQRRGKGVGENFTVRKVSAGVGVERIFPLHSPNISKIELVKSGKVRRARLFYLRKTGGRAAKVGEEKESKPKSQADAKNA